jgi:transposase-like protein
MQKVTEKPSSGRRGRSQRQLAVDPGELPEGTRDRLRELLPEEALQDALNGLDPEEITGQGGLLSQLAGRVINAALEGELTDHLGYPPGQAPPGGSGNMRNGSTPKTVNTELGALDVKTPRDRQGSFDPKLVAKRQTRLAGLDDRILGMYAGGMTVRDIEAHVQSLYGVQIGRDTISRVTDRVLEDIAVWRARPLEAIYPIVYFDALMVKMTEDRSVKTRACYLAVGVTLEGEREILGLWWQDKEGAKFWLAVLNDLHQRGVKDILIACVDGLTGFPEAIAAVYPEAWIQTCIVHMIRSSMRYVSYVDRKPIARDLRLVYAATNAEEAERQLELFDQTWGEKYPMVAQAWRARWEYVIPFLSLPADLRRVVYTTNAIEGLNRQVRKAIKTRGHFPDEQAATKLIYLALMRAEIKWKKVMHWTAALRALKIHFGDRIPD